MAEAAKEILAINPKEVNALFWLTALTLTLPPTPDTLATGEKAAQGVLDAQRPEGVKDEDWAKMKASMDMSAHNTLAFIALQKKDPAAAEKEYVKSLEANPGQAEVSYSLGNAILAQKKPERQPEVLFHWARAASLKGPGALPADKQKTIDAFFVKQYNTFHGNDEAGLKSLRELATGAKPLPPAGFEMKNKNEIEAKKEADAAAANPAGHLWTTIKDQLTAANGEQYFEMSVKGAALPGGVNGIKKFKGKLISQKPALKPKTLVVSISGDTPEVTLNLEGFVLPGKAEPGTEIAFEGVASAFTKQPFNADLRRGQQRQDRRLARPGCARSGQESTPRAQEEAVGYQARGRAEIVPALTLGAIRSGILRPGSCHSTNTNAILAATCLKSSRSSRTSRWQSMRAVGGRSNA